MNKNKYIQILDKIGGYDTTAKIQKLVADDKKVPIDIAKDFISLEKNKCLSDEERMVILAEFIKEYIERIDIFSAENTYLKDYIYRFIELLEFSKEIDKYEIYKIGSTSGSNLLNNYSKYLLDRIKEVNNLDIDDENDNDEMFNDLEVSKYGKS